MESKEAHHDLHITGRSAPFLGKKPALKNVRIHINSHVVQAIKEKIQGEYHAHLRRLIEKGLEDLRFNHKLGDVALSSIEIVFSINAALEYQGKFFCCLCSQKIESVKIEEVKQKSENPVKKKNTSGIWYRVDGNQVIDFDSKIKSSQISAPIFLNALSKAEAEGKKFFIIFDYDPNKKVLIENWEDTQKEVFTKIAIINRLDLRVFTDETHNNFREACKYVISDKEKAKKIEEAAEEAIKNFDLIRHLANGCDQPYNALFMFGTPSVQKETSEPSNAGQQEKISQQIIDLDKKSKEMWGDNIASVYEKTTKFLVFLKTEPSIEERKFFRK